MGIVLPTSSVFFLALAFGESLLSASCGLLFGIFGRLNLTVDSVKKSEHASIVSVSYKYDQLREEEVDESQSKHPDFDRDYGLPYDTGVFWFAIPANWKL